MIRHNFHKSPSVLLSAPLRSCVLVGLFLGAVGLRLLIGGPGAAHSPLAGLIFTGILVIGCAIFGLTTTISKRVVAYGVAGAAVLCIAPLLQLNPNHAHPAGNFVAWAVTVSLVALAEEAFLRGTLFDAITKWHGQTAAILVTAFLFMLLHLPLYGIRSAPLDFLVGIWFGVLRVKTGSWLTAGIAHTLADLLGWWLI